MTTYRFIGFELEFTEKEWKTLIGVYGRLSDKELSNKLHISIYIVNHAIKRLKHLTGCKNRDDLAEWYSNRRIQYYVHLRRNHGVKRES